MRATRTVALLLTALLAVGIASADLTLEDLSKLGRKNPIFVRVTFASPLGEKDVRGLRQLQLRPTTQNTRALIGRDTLVFATSGRTAVKLDQDERVEAVEWVRNYPAASHYWAHFRYEGDAAAPELTFTIPTSRSATGRELQDLHCFVSPQTEFSLQTDEGDNQFLIATFTDVQPGQDLLFDFYASYEYDTAAIIEGSVATLGETPMPDAWPEEVQPFLQPGFHIESDAAEIVAQANELATSNLLNERANAILGWVGQNIKYDTEKRDKYFGGRYVYNDAWEMWQGALATLQRGIGCCPDTAELKVAMLRAAGIPARTAVHSGHLYAEAYVPDRGWLTDAPMHNVPLIRSPGADNTAYFAWTPAAPVRCLTWGGKVTAFGQLRPGMTVGE